jgi:hypothetical protein
MEHIPNGIRDITIDGNAHGMAIAEFGAIITLNIGILKVFALVNWIKGKFY